MKVKNNSTISIIKANMLSAKTAMLTKAAMLSAKTALGIDIAEGRINLALLKKGADGVELVKTATVPVPDGAIKAGSIEDAAMLSKAIRELKTRNKIRTTQAAVSLFVRPLLVQLMDMPKQVPGNIGQFVQNEVKHCVALSGREIAFDYCGVGSPGQAQNRLFVAATDGERAARLAKAFSQARINVGAIEPPLLAYTRAFYAKRIAGKFDCNVLIAILEGDALTLCLFRNQTLDFVRTKNISKEKAEKKELCQWLANEINEIIQFYDVEVADSSGVWEITVVADTVQLPKDAEQSLAAEVPNANLQLRTAENVHLDTPFGQNADSAETSPVAIGLAMKLLDEDGVNLKINLLPPETAEVKAAKKHVLITANIIAAVLFLMILAGGWFSLMTKKVNANITHVKQTELSQSTYTLLRQQESLDRQIEQLSERPEELNNILSSRYDIDWGQVLNDVKNTTPKTLRITEMFSKGGSNVHIKGLALSYEAVHLFVRMLNTSEHIDSTSLVESQKDNQYGGLVRYTINCSLAQIKGKTADDI